VLHLAEDTIRVLDETENCYLARFTYFLVVVFFVVTAGAADYVKRLVSDMSGCASRVSKSVSKALWYRPCIEFRLRHHHVSPGIHGWVP